MGVGWKYLKIEYIESWSNWDDSYIHVIGLMTPATVAHCPL